MKLPNCLACNSVVQAEDAFCQSCGALVRQASQTPVSNAGATPTPVPQIKAGVNTCSSCGESNPLDSAFCEKCGAKLQPGKVVTPLPQPGPSITKVGFLIFPDGTKLEITPKLKTIGRVELAKHVTSQEVNWVSRAHFTVFQEGEKFFVEDGKTVVQEHPSTNKTWLMSGGTEQEITDKGKYELKDGDQLSVAKVVKIEFKTK